MLDSISHIALVVSDPGRTASLFETLFEAETRRRRDADGHDETFIKLGNTWFMLAKATVERQRTGDHIAFRATRDEWAATAEKLEAMGLEFVLVRSETSLYFFDYDNHVFELDTSDIGGELEAEASVSP